MKIRDYPGTWNLDQLIKHIKPWFKDRDIATELIDQSGFDHCPLFRLKQCQCPIELGKYSATFYISHKEDWRLNHLGKPHVHYVILFKIDLCRTACPLDHDDIVF